MMHMQSTPHTLFGDVQISPVRPQDRKINHSPIETRLTYLNHTNHPITVEWRSGLKCVLRPEPNFETNKLIVRVEITIHPQVKLDIQRVLSAVTDAASAEMKAMRTSFNLSLKAGHYGSIVMILDYSLTVEQLRQFGGSVYYHEVDCVFSLLSLEHSPPHPHSPAGRNLCLIDADGDGNMTGFRYSIEIIDNAGKFGDRYLNIGNKVYRAPAQKDHERRDGVYVVSNEPVEGQIEMSERKVQLYSFEQAKEQLGLYRTPEEAMNLGDVSQAKKEELLNLEHQIQVEKAELARERQQHEKEMLDKEKALKEAEEARDRNARVIDEMRSEQEHRQKLERERVKDYYEDRSYERKDSNETLKFLPTLILGIGAAVAAVFKWLR
jgi:hypothetical protein